MRNRLHSSLKVPLKIGLGGLCAYELIALTPTPIPPITTIVHKHRSESLACRLIVWAWLGLVAWHLLFEEDPDIIILDETNLLLQ